MKQVTLSKNSNAESNLFVKNNRTEAKEEIEEDHVFKEIMKEAYQVGKFSNNHQ